MIPAYPLQWPEGYKRSHCKEASRFRVTTVNSQINEVLNELKLLNASGVIISSNLPVRKDGLPYSNFRSLDDAGVAVYFKFKDNNVVMACDQYKKVEDNLHAIALTIGAMRGMERWGVSEMLNRMFTGFTALPDKTHAWYEVLEVSEKATKDEINTAYRTLAKLHHPDAGGDTDKFTELTDAYKKGMEGK